MSASNTPLSVVLAGGGTAGHIEPAMAVADALRALDPDVRITALGTERGLETSLVPARGYDLQLIPPVPLPRKPTADMAKLPARVRLAVRRCREVFDAVDADVVIGFGGYVALPAYLAARRSALSRRPALPVVIHEANARAGIANKVGARTASHILAAVPGTGLPKAQVIGIPVRDTITGLDRAALRKQGREYFGLPTEHESKVLLVFGGSQGARSLNEAVSGAADALINAGISVIHAHGPKNTLDLDLAQFQDKAAKYVALPYVSRMDLAYAAADLAICRSGAMTVAEVSAVGLGAIYVPLPHGNGEQELNARPVVNAGGGELISDAELTSEYIADHVLSLFADQPRLRQMGAAAGDAGHRDAAAAIAKIVLDTARSAREAASS